MRQKAGFFSTFAISTCAYETGFDQFYTRARPVLAGSNEKCPRFGRAFYRVYWALWAHINRSAVDPGIHEVLIFFDPFFRNFLRVALVFEHLDDPFVDLVAGELHALEHLGHGWIPVIE